jgi:hypothetical protein
MKGLMPAILLLVVCGSACNEQSQQVPLLTINDNPHTILFNINDSIINKAAALIRTGDLILRTGTDFSSDEVKAISPSDKTYSHAGIALVDSSGIFVYHIEPDHLHVGDKVRKEPLDSFCNPQKNMGIAIARYDLSLSEKSIFLSYMEKQYSNKIPFDIHFDLRSTDSMYCSEMIRNGLSLATNRRLLLPTYRFNDRNKYKIMRQYLRLPEKSIANREIIPIDHLFINPNCRMISRFLFHRLQSPQL